MRKKQRRYSSNKIRNNIIEFIKENKKIYFILIIIFFMGLVIGVLSINNFDKLSYENMENYISNFINEVKGEYKLSTKELLINSSIKNIIMVLIISLLGLTVIGLPIIYLIIVYKGYLLGYTISAILAIIGKTKGIILIISTILFQNIIYIPVIVSLAINSINLCKEIVEDRRKENIKIQIVKHIIFSVFMLIIIIFAALIETYISGNLTVQILKYL